MRSHISEADTVPSDGIIMPKGAVCSLAEGLIEEAGGNSKTNFTSEKCWVFALTTAKSTNTALVCKSIHAWSCIPLNSVEAAAFCKGTVTLNPDPL